MSMAIYILFAVSLVSLTQAFFAPAGRRSLWGGRFGNKLWANTGFDAREFEEALKKAGPMPPSASSGGKGGDGDEVLKMMREEQKLQREQIYREYPYEQTELPILPDRNNYYSGSLGDWFWHQNADQVYVFIPLPEGVGKKDIDVKFSALSVEVLIDDKRLAYFECLERIIPDGSFWVVEASAKDGKRYLQLDLEKRFRMINWKNLFDKAPPSPASKTGGSSPADLESRSKMLEKLFAANKGMSKIMKDAGQDPETVDEMLENQDLVKMISDKIYGPRDEGGEDLSDMLGDVELLGPAGEGAGIIDEEEEEEENIIDVVDEGKA